MLSRFRPRRVSQVGLTLTALLMLSVAYDIGFVDGMWVFAVPPLGAAVAMLLAAFGTYIEVHDTHIRISNLGVRKTVRLHAIVSAVPDYWGILLKDDLGGVSIGMAVQETNAMAWLRPGASRAAKLAEHIQQLARHARLRAGDG